MLKVDTVPATLVITLPHEKPHDVGMSYKAIITSEDAKMLIPLLASVFPVEFSDFIAERAAHVRHQAYQHAPGFVR